MLRSCNDIGACQMEQVEQCVVAATFTSVSAITQQSVTSER